jgi:hypothetical protein
MLLPALFPDPQIFGQKNSQHSQKIFFGSKKLASAFYFRIKCLKVVIKICYYTEFVTEIFGKFPNFPAKLAGRQGHNHGNSGCQGQTTAPAITKFIPMVWIFKSFFLPVQ